MPTNTIYGTSNGETLSGKYDTTIVPGGSGDRLTATRVATGLANPLDAGAAPGDADGLYVVEKATGKIIRIDLDTGAKTTFLVIPDTELGSANEEGALGLAFHPDYASNGRFFVFLVNSAGNLEVREYARSATNSNVANPTPVKDIINIAHPTNSNHNGGSLAFGSDGLLYISTGDGGGGGDPANNAQNLNSLLGKILRVDVDADGFPNDSGSNYAIPSSNPFASSAGVDEIWAFGLRNPWRIAFDPATGNLWIGDVGQDAREEIDVIPGGSGGGQNFGWKIKEGSIDYAGGTVTNGPLVAPVYEYTHAQGQSVTGGYVYRGSGDYNGDYIFADFISGKVWALSYNGGSGSATDITSKVDSATGTLSFLSSFGTDNSGDLYAVSYGGSVYRLTGSTGSTTVRTDYDDTIHGLAGDDRIYGWAGNDKLYGSLGADRIVGDAGTDLIDGSVGRDIMTGGSQADVFDFNRVTDTGRTVATRDRITDFQRGVDDIDLSTIDANTKSAGNQAFKWIGSQPFHRIPGELHIVKYGKDIILEGDVSGDGKVDFQIELDLLSTLSKSDIVL